VRTFIDVGILRLKVKRGNEQANRRTKKIRRGACCQIKKGRETMNIFRKIKRKTP